MKQLQCSVWKSLLFVLTLTMVPQQRVHAQCADVTATGDCDGDGVPNGVDQDDDNDGILDVNETIAGSIWWSANTAASDFRRCFCHVFSTL